MRRFVAVLTGGLLLSACWGGSEELPDVMSEKQTAVDRLPSEALANGLEIDPGSSRLVATVGTKTLWMSLAGNDACLTVQDASRPSDVLSACGAGAWLGMSVLDAEFELRRYGGAKERDGWTRVNEYVLSKD